MYGKARIRGWVNWSVFVSYKICKSFSSLLRFLRFAWRVSLDLTRIFQPESNASDNCSIRQPWPGVNQPICANLANIIRVCVCVVCCLPKSRVRRPKPGPPENEFALFAPLNCHICTTNTHTAHMAHGPGANGQRPINQFRFLVPPTENPKIW